jgi:hypothetical protein
MRIFVSYHTPDHDEADRLRAALSTRTPGLDFYFAPAHNSAGACWLPRLAEELQAFLDEAKAWSPVWSSATGSAVWRWHRRAEPKTAPKHPKLRVCAAFGFVR